MFIPLVKCLMWTMSKTFFIKAFHQENSCYVMHIYLQKPSQRTWKPIYAVLKGHRLFCYKDGGNEAFDDEIIQPIPVRSSTIKIASDYTKKRHVFRLVTSHGNEYLFQVSGKFIPSNFNEQLFGGSYKFSCGFSHIY